MAARDEESDLESDWTFVDRGTIESVETRQGSVFYSKRTTSQSSDEAPRSPDVAVVTAEGSGSEAEFEVLARFPAQTAPGPICEEKTEVAGSVVAITDSNGADYDADMPSASSEDSSELLHCPDDGIMIISNHFSPSLEETHDNLHNSSILSLSFQGWQELPLLTESTTSSVSDEPCISDDETGIVTISDEAEDQGMEYVHLGQHQRADEEDGMLEHSDLSSFLFDGDLFDVSEDLEVLDLSESLEVDSVRKHHPGHQSNADKKGDGSESSDGDDSNDGEEDEEEDEEEEEEEEIGTLVTVDAPTLVILLCLTTALGFSIGHGLNVYLSSRASGNSAHLQRPGPETVSLQNQHLSLKLPEDKFNQEQVYLWEEKEASIALMFDLKELHSKLQKEHFSLLKSYDNMKNRLHMSKVMGWYWRWKFEHEKVASDMGWNKALEKQVERLHTLYAREKRLADQWRDVKIKEARRKLHKYWKTLHHRWVKTGGKTNSDPTNTLNQENSSASDAHVGVCSKSVPAEFKRRWTQDARGGDHALNQYRIAVSNGQETRVFKWDQTMMKAVRETEGPARNEGPGNLLVIYHPGSLVKDVVVNPDKKNPSVDNPLSLRLVLEDGSVKDISSNFHKSKGNRSLVDEKRKEKDRIIGKQCKRSVPLYTGSYASKHRECPAATGVQASTQGQEQFDRREFFLSKTTSSAEGREDLNPTVTRHTGVDEDSEDATSETEQRRVRRPCFEKPAESSEEKEVEQRKPEEFPLANETIPDVYREIAKEKEARKKVWRAKQKKERLMRRKLKQREQDLRRHVRRAEKILQALYRERRRIRTQKVQLRHERCAIEKAKTKLDYERKQHEQNKDDVGKLIVQLKTEKERLKNWHKKEEEAFKQSLSVQIRKLEKNRQKCEKEKGAELRQIKTKLSLERRKLKRDYKELKSLKKAARKEYKKWLRELRQVRKKEKKIRGKSDKKGRKGMKRHEHERRKHKERDKKKSKRKDKKKGELENKKHDRDIVQNKASFTTKKSKGKQNMERQLSSGNSKHAENSKGRVSDDEQVDIVQEGQQYDYRKQLEKLRQWWLQNEEQKLDQEQLQREYKKPKIQKHLKRAPTEQWNNKPRNTAVQTEKGKAVVAFADFSLKFDASSSKVHETQEEYNNTIRRKKDSEKSDSEGLGTTAGGNDAPRQARFKANSRRSKRKASSKVSEHYESQPKGPDVDPNPPSGPIPIDKRARGQPKAGSYMHLNQEQQFDENVRNRWVNRATKQESCFSRNPKPPDGPIPPDGLRFPRGGPRGQWKEETARDESWYMRRAKERESLRKFNSFHTRKPRAYRPTAWMFERASNRAEQRSNWEPWYERRAKGRDEWRAIHRDTWSALERGYYRKMMNYMSDWRESLVSPRGPTKRRGCWGA